MKAGVAAIACGTLLFLATSWRHAVAGDWIYFANEHDTLWDLCLQYTNKRGCWIELGKYNNIANDRKIPVGAEIRIPLEWLSESVAVGVAASVRGEVSYQAPGAPGAGPLLAGQALVLGSRIVSRGGTARIELGEHSSLLVRPGTELLLDSLSIDAARTPATELQLPVGELEVDVRQRSRFRIQTPSAIAAVRGTRFRLTSEDSEPPRTRGEVLAGSVQVQSGGSEPVVVPEGYGVVAQQGRAPEAARELLPPPRFNQASLSGPQPLSIAWQADTGAVGWQLDILAGAAPGDLLQTYRVATPGYTLTGMPEGCYRAQLRAVDAAGFWGMESEIPVCVVPAPPPPEPEPETAGSTIKALLVAALLIAAMALL